MCLSWCESAERRLDMATSDMACGMREHSASYKIQFETTCPEQVHSLFIFWDWKGVAGLLVSSSGPNLAHFIGQVMPRNGIRVLAITHCLGQQPK